MRNIIIKNYVERVKKNVKENNQELEFIVGLNLKKDNRIDQVWYLSENPCIKLLYHAFSLLT